MREYTRYAIQEIIQPFEYEKLVSEIIFNLDQDSSFPDREYPDIRQIGGYKDYGHDAISITWKHEEEEYSKVVFAFSKRKDWRSKLEEDLEKRREDEKTKRFIYITTERVGNGKLPKNLTDLKDEFGFPVEIIDIDDIVIWLDNTTWGKSLKMKYGFDSDDALIYLKSNDKMLLSNEKKEEYFRISGPILIDFMKDTIYKRKEVEEIISKIGDNKIHIISGLPASGKTVLARNICFELRDSYQIYWLNIEDLVRDPTRIYSEMNKVDCSNALLVLEDAHKYLNELEALITYINDDIRMLKLLITARTLDKQRIMRFKQVSDLFRNPNYVTEINACDISQDLISFYSEKIKIEKPPVIDDFDSCLDDLWVLSYTLKAWMEKKEIKKDIVYEKIYNDLISYNDQFGKGASDIILIISLITSRPTIIKESEFEFNYIPIDDFFLIDKLGYSPEVLSKLVHNGLIRRMDESSYWCWHTSLSSLYVEVAEKYPTLLSRINLKSKEILGNSFDNEEYLFLNNNVFHVYLRIHPEYVDKILSIVATTGLFGIGDFISDLDTKELIFSQLEKGSLEQINSLVYIINQARILFTDYEVLYDELIEIFGPDKIKQKIEQCSNGRDVIAYASLFNLMNKKDVSMKILDEFKDKIIRDINSGENGLFDIRNGLDLVSDISPDIAKSIVIGIQETIPEKIKASPLWEISLFYGTIKELDNMMANEQLTRNWNLIKKRVVEGKKSPVSELLSALSTISEIDDTKGKELIELIGKTYIIERIKAIEDVNEIQSVVFGIKKMDSSFREALLIEVTNFLESEIAKRGVLPLRDVIAKLHKENYNMLKGILNRMNRDIVEEIKKQKDYDFLLEEID